MLRAITALLVLQSLSYGAGVFESSPEYEAATAIAEKTEIDTSSAAKAQSKKRVGPIEVRAARSEFMQLWTRLSADLNYTSLEQSDFVSPEILTSNHLFAGQVRSLFEGLKKLKSVDKERSLQKVRKLKVSIKSMLAAMTSPEAANSAESLTREVVGEKLLLKDITPEELMRVLRVNLLRMPLNLKLASEENEKTFSEWLSKRTTYTWNHVNKLCKYALGTGDKSSGVVLLCALKFIRKCIKNYFPECYELSVLDELIQSLTRRPVTFGGDDRNLIEVMSRDILGTNHREGSFAPSLLGSYLTLFADIKAGYLKYLTIMTQQGWAAQINFDSEFRTFKSEDERSLGFRKALQNEPYILFLNVLRGMVFHDEKEQKVKGAEKLEYMIRLCKNMRSNEKSLAYIDLIRNCGLRTRLDGRPFKEEELYEVVGGLMFEVGSNKSKAEFVELLLDGKMDVTYAHWWQSNKLQTLDEKFKEAVKLIHKFRESYSFAFLTRLHLRNFCEDQVLKVGSNEPQVSDDTWDWAVKIFKGVDEYSFISNTCDRIRNMRCDFESDNEEDAGAESNESLGADLEPLLSQYESNLNSALSSFGEVRAEESKQNPDRQWLETFRQVEWEQVRAREKVINDYHAGLRGLRKGFKSGRLDLEASERRAQPPVVEPESSTTKLSPYKDWGREISGEELLVDNKKGEDNKESSIPDRLVDDILEGRAPRCSVKGGKASLPPGVLTSGPEGADYWEAAVSFSSNLRLYYYFDSENKKVIAQVGPHLKG